MIKTYPSNLGVCQVNNSDFRAQSGRESYTLNNRQENESLREKARIAKGIMKTQH